MKQFAAIGLERLDSPADYQWVLLSLEDITQDSFLECGRLLDHVNIIVATQRHYCHYEP